MQYRATLAALMAAIGLGGLVGVAAYAAMNERIYGECSMCGDEGIEVSRMYDGAGKGLYLCDDCAGR